MIMEIPAWQQQKTPADPLVPRTCATPPPGRPMPEVNENENGNGNGQVEPERDRVIAGLREELIVMQALCAEQQDELISVLTDSTLIVDVVRAKNELDPEAFLVGDRCLVIDPESQYAKQLGTIRVVPNQVGNIELELASGLRREFHIGNAAPPQVKLLGKDDGTNVTIAVEGKHYEAFGIPGLILNPGDAVRVHVKSRQILGKSDLPRGGTIAHVTALIDENKIEVEIGGAKKIVLTGPPKTEAVVEDADAPIDAGQAVATPQVAALTPPLALSQVDAQFEQIKASSEDVAEALEVVAEEQEIAGDMLREVPVKVGDRLLLDSSATVVIGYLPPDNASANRLTQEIDVDFRDIAGVEDAKEAIREAIEYPLTHKDLYEHFGKKTSKGVLLYGPPGCGKTLLGKAITKKLAEMYGSAAITSGFIYIKGPELLNPYVGRTEENIRSIFHRGELHYEKHGYPAVLFIDEADALLPQRGRFSGTFDIAETSVPMFLSCMDGLTESHVIVILATNRPKMLDPAAIRPGRCSQHIKVGRPDLNSTPDYFLIHLRNTPLAGDLAKDDPNYKATRKRTMVEAAAFASAEVFSTSRTLYSVTEGATSRNFHFGDCINGAMIEGIVGQAENLAIARIIKTGKEIMGITTKELREAVEVVYRQQVGQNHVFDLEDFCEKNGINQRKADISPCAAEY